MNGAQNTDASLSGLVPRPALSGSPHGPATGFMHPDEVAGDLRLTPAEKREILAAWASDAHAVPDAPALRRLDNGAVVRVDDVLRALGSLDAGADARRTAPGPARPFARLRARLPARLRSALRRSWSDDDDDDPPPCPATVVGPVSGPLAGGEAVEAGLALAA
jgi:hypothetical protein